MTLSPMVAQRVAAYEQENGRKPKKIVLEMAEHIEKVGKMLTEQGLKDAQQSKPAHPATAFLALVRKAFRMDPDEDHGMVQAVADLWHSDCMDIYQKGGEADGM